MGDDRIFEGRNDYLMFMDLRKDTTEMNDPAASSGVSRIQKPEFRRQNKTTIQTVFIMNCPAASHGVSRIQNTESRSQNPEE